MRQRIRAWFERIAADPDSIRYTEAGNRSIVRLNYKALFQDPVLARLAAEYRATGTFTGLLMELAPTDEAFVKEIRDNLALLDKHQEAGATKIGPMWRDYNRRMIQSILQADPRLFNHMGALSYKTFTPKNPDLSLALRQVLCARMAYDHLSPEQQKFEGIFTGLNHPHFTWENHRLSEGIRAYEHMRILQSVLQNLRVERKTPKVLEIGAGNGQLAALFLREGAKVVVIDLPGMHTQGPFLLHKLAGARVCLWKRYLELERNIEKVFSEYDLLYLPPWEASRIESGFDLAANVYSLGEMSPPEVNGYLSLIRKTCDTFYSVNTTLRGLDRKRQPEYQENSTLSFNDQLQMRICKTGMLLYDTLLHRTPHYAYAVYSRVFSASDLEVTQSQTVEFTRQT